MCLNAMEIWDRKEEFFFIQNQRNFSKKENILEIIDHKILNPSFKVIKSQSTILHFAFF